MSDSTEGAGVTEASAGLSRRRFLGWLGAAGAAGAAGVAGLAVGDDVRSDASSARDEDAVPFYGAHQAGIATRQQRHIVFASLDVAEASAETLGGLFRFWTRAAATMARGERVEVPGGSGGILWD